MISRTLGAPFGGTRRDGHHGLESFALSLIAPPNSGGGGGSCLPSIVTVALGDPGVPVVCWAIAPGRWLVPRRKPNESAVVIFMATSPYGNIVFQSFFISTTVQPSASAASSA